MRLAAVLKSTGVLSERLTAVPQSRRKRSGLLGCLQVADEQLKLAGRGYDGCFNRIEQRLPQVVLGFCPCGPLRLNISPKKDRINKINVNCVSHTVVENLKQLAFKGHKSRVVRRTF
jgi:hypothetical protein